MQLQSDPPIAATAAMSAAGAPAPAAASLSSALSSLPSAASFAVQCDWETVLREYNTARTAGGEAAAQRLPKESRQFWISAARFDQEQSHCEAVAHLDSEATTAANAAAAGSGSSAAATAATASAASSGAATAATSLTAAARSVRLRPEGDADASTMDLQFRNPLQLLAHYPSLSLTQLLQAPRATHSHLHPKGDVFTVDVSAQGNRGLSGGADGSLRVWDAQTALLRADLSGHHGDVTLARWFPSGVVALSAGLDVAVRIWAVEPRAALATQLVGHQRPVTAVCFVGRGRTLVTASEDGTARLWDVSTQQTVVAYPAHKEEFPEPVRDALLLDPQSHPVALSAEAGEVRHRRHRRCLSWTTRRLQPCHCSYPPCTRGAHFVCFVAVTTLGPFLFPHPALRDQRSPVADCVRRRHRARVRHAHPGAGDDAALGGSRGRDRVARARARPGLVHPGNGRGRYCCHRLEE